MAWHYGELHDYYRYARKPYLTHESTHALRIRFELLRLLESDVRSELDIPRDVADAVVSVYRRAALRQRDGRWWLARAGWLTWTDGRMARVVQTSLTLEDRCELARIRNRTRAR